LVVPDECLREGVGADRNGGVRCGGRPCDGGLPAKEVVADRSPDEVIDGRFRGRRCRVGAVRWHVRW
jgi:hypothetical protein